MNKKQLIVAWAVGIFVLLCCLVPLTNSYAEFNYYGETQGGFWAGFWDGVKSPITIPLNVFWESINVYNSNNNGFNYNLGFFVPAILLTELTIPLFIIAWIIKIAFFLIMIIICWLSSWFSGKG